MSLKPTVYAKAKDPNVDPFSPRTIKIEQETMSCELNNTQETIDDEHMKMFNDLNTARDSMNEEPMDLREFYEYRRDEHHWSPITFTLFSKLVATGFLAAFTPMTFYAVLVYGSAAAVRLAFVFSTWQGFTYEVTKPEALMKLFECCYMMRHEENLIAEEECYRMIQEIIRQPELYK